MDLSKIPTIISALSSTCQFTQENSDFYQASGVCPPLAGLFLNQSILHTELKHMITANIQKNIVLTDENDKILLICIVNEHMSLLKALFQLIHNDVDKLHTQNHRYSAERLITAKTVMYCHGTRMTMEKNSYGPYEHQPDFTEKHESQIQNFVRAVWNEVNVNCTSLFSSHDTPAYYTGTPFSKMSYSYNSDRSFNTDPNNWAYTVAFVTSLNGLSPPGIFVLSACNICCHQY